MTPDDVLAAIASQCPPYMEVANVQVMGSGRVSVAFWLRTCGTAERYVSVVFDNLMEALAEILEALPYVTEDKMNIFSTDLFKYITGDMLVGKQASKTIASVKLEKLTSSRGTDDKPVVYFKGSNKGWVLNKTAAKALGKLLGPETDAWKGATVVLTAEPMQAFGETMNIIRVVSAKLQGGKEAPAADELGADVDEDGNVVEGTYTEITAVTTPAKQTESIDAVALGAAVRPQHYASQRYVLDDIKNHILEDVVKAILTDCTDYKHERHVLNAIAHYPFDDKQSAAIESGKFKLDAGQKISKTFALALYDWLVARKEAPAADSNAVQEAMFESQENGAYAE